MTERKFTDDEIIRALELCFTPKGTSDTCAKCPYHVFGALCKVKRSRDALDLIKRYKAEIEKEKKNLRKMFGENSKLKDKLRKLQKLETNVIEAQKDLFEEARAEAIKEFAERLAEVEQPRTCIYDSDYVPTVTMQQVYDLLKEMTGDAGKEDAP